MIAMLMDQPFDLDIRVILLLYKQYEFIFFYYEIYNRIWYVYIDPHNSLEVHAQD